MLRILKNFSIVRLKDEMRKLGVNFITGGFIGLFVTHITELKPFSIAMMLWLILFGIIALGLGLYKV